MKAAITAVLLSLLVVSSASSAPAGAAASSELRFEAAGLRIGGEVVQGEVLQLRT